MLVIVVVGGIPWTYFNIKYSREIARELTRLREAGEPLSITEMIPEPVPDDQNAAMLYQEVFQVSFDRDKPQPKRVQAFGAIPPDEYKLLLDGRGYDEQFDFNLAREVFARPEVIDVLNTIEQASLRPQCAWPIHWEDGFYALFPHLAQHREAARLMAMRARLSAEGGDVDDALRWVGVSLRMSRHVMQEPTLISQLVALAIQSIAMRAAQQSLDTAAPSPEAAARLTDLAGTLDMAAGMHLALQWERVNGLAAFDGFQREKPQSTWGALDDSVPAGGMNVYQPYGGVIGAPIRAFDQARMLANWRVYLPDLDRPYRLQDMDVPKRAPRGWTVLAILSNMMSPVFDRTAAKRDQAIANRDIFCTALALKVHRQQHGAYPVSLADLQATLDWQLPDDPFSGKPYRYERRDQGFALWSVGEDLEDDGGIPPEPRSDLDWDESDIVWLSTQ